VSRYNGLGGLVVRAGKLHRQGRQSRFGVWCIALQAIAFVMFNGDGGRIKVVQIMLHGMGEAHLQNQHQ
jgi:hypothetical protein